MLLHLNCLHYSRLNEWMTFIAHLACSIINAIHYNNRENMLIVLTIHVLFFFLAASNSSYEFHCAKDRPVFSRHLPSDSMNKSQ